MNYLISQVIKTPLTNLNFIERWGGLVKAVEIVTEAGGRQSFPVSCDLSAAECYEQGKYQRLVPNDKYKSVAYLESKSDLSLSRGDVGSDVVAPVDVRLVVWLNFNKMGLNDCKSTDRFELAVYQALEGDNRFEIDGIKGTLFVNELRIVQKDHRAIFSPYSYNAKDAVFFHPYGFFAMDIRGEITITKGCIEAVSLGSEIECLTNW